MATWDNKTWAAGEVVTNSALNTYLRDNMDLLKDPTTSGYQFDELSDYTTTSSAFVAVDSTNGKFRQTLDTYGGDVLVTFAGAAGGNNDVTFDIAVDGNRQAGEDGLYNVANRSNAFRFSNASFAYWVTGLAAGVHTFDLMWRSEGGGTVRVPVGSASGGYSQYHPQFLVREVS